MECIYTNIIFYFQRYQYLIVPKQVIKDKSCGGDLAIDECITSSPDITCMIYRFCWLIFNQYFICIFSGVWIIGTIDHFVFQDIGSKLNPSSKTGITLLSCLVRNTLPYLVIYYGKYICMLKILNENQAIFFQHLVQ